MPDWARASAGAATWVHYGAPCCPRAGIDGCPFGTAGLGGARADECSRTGAHRNRDRGAPTGTAASRRERAGEGAFRRAELAASPG